MIDINQWMRQYQDTVKSIFGGRVLFIGLQGSFGRGEANENSDIDVVLILDKVSLDDLKEYKDAIEKTAEGSQTELARYSDLML